MILNNISGLNPIVLFSTPLCLPVHGPGREQTVLCCPNPFLLQRCYLDQAPAIKRSSKDLKQNRAALPTHHILWFCDQTPGPDRYIKWGARQRVLGLCGSKKRGEYHIGFLQPFYKIYPLQIVGYWGVQRPVKIYWSLFWKLNNTTTLTIKMPFFISSDWSCQSINTSIFFKVL